MALLVGGVASIAGLWATGYVSLPFLQRTGTNQDGKVQVLMSGVAIPAYTLVTRDHLLNPETKEAASFWLAKEQIPPNVIPDLAGIAGRVLKHDKPAGYFFTEDDFFPKGTRPGIVAGIPPGKRSMTLEATKIQGANGLKAGDRFDVIASIATDQRHRTNGPKSLGITTAGNASPLSKEARVRVVVENGAVVMPVYTRAVPTLSTSLTSGTQASAKPVQELVIAVEPYEVPMLAEAMTLEAELIAVARSGSPEDNQQSRITTELSEPPKTQVIETIFGKRRDQISVPLLPATNVPGLGQVKVGDGKS
jgi:Flp pilus assembly protein CpaB